MVYFYVIYNPCFQLKIKTVVPRTYYSWAVWLPIIITPGRYVARVCVKICILNIQRQGFLRVPWVILELFFPLKWCIGTLKQLMVSIFKIKSCAKGVFYLGCMDSQKNLPRGPHYQSVVKILLLDVKPWGFLKVHWVIIEHVCLHHRQIITNITVNWLHELFFHIMSVENEYMPNPEEDSYLGKEAYRGDRNPCTQV